MPIELAIVFQRKYRFALPEPLQAFMYIHSMYIKLSIFRMMMYYLKIIDRICSRNAYLMKETGARDDTNLISK